MHTMSGEITTSGDYFVIRLSRQTVVFLHAVAFVLGFSVVFIVGWGGAATLLGQLFSDYKASISKVGGVVVILFGLHTLGILRLRWLNRDTRRQLGAGEGGGFVSSGLMGVFFAAGWTPCIGATLGAILTLGFSQETSGQAMVLAGGYALGLGIPFLVLGLMMARASAFTRRIRPYLRSIEIVSGLLQILIGLMLLTNSLYVIAIWAQRNGLFIDLQAGGASPTIWIAVAAGLLSFLSPCVLPLVPAYLGYMSRHIASPSHIRYEEKHD
jgi:cytochrome c-type biogenesis protein